MDNTRQGAFSSEVFNFPVDYNDHFETPLVAYQDILPLLDLIEPSRSQHILYDPYYCNGRVVTYLQSLGFTQVRHERRDFYRDIADRQVPLHQTLITNPPYSGNHKERCLQFAIQQWMDHRRPFFLLLPNYVAVRNYFQEIARDYLPDIVYVSPIHPYHFDHPEGTGYDSPPFTSLWICGVGRDVVSRLTALGGNCYGNHASGTKPVTARTTTTCLAVPPRPSSRNLMTQPTVTTTTAPTTSTIMTNAILLTSWKELEQSRLVPLQKRPNPRQRRKQQQQQQKKLVVVHTVPTFTAATIKATTHTRADSTPSQSPRTHGDDRNCIPQGQPPSRTTTTTTTNTTVGRDKHHKRSDQTMIQTTAVDIATLKKRKRKSRYRDECGERIRKRF